MKNLNLPEIINSEKQRSLRVTIPNYWDWDWDLSTDPWFIVSYWIKVSFPETKVLGKIIQFGSLILLIAGTIAEVRAVLVLCLNVMVSAATRRTV